MVNIVLLLDVFPPDRRENDFIHVLIKNLINSFPLYLDMLPLH